MNDTLHRVTDHPQGLFPWYQGWTVLAAMMAVHAFAFGLYASFTFWVNPWMETFAVPRSQIMLAMMAVGLGMSLLSPFVGKAMDRIAIHHMVVAGMLLLALAMALLSVTTSIVQIIAIYAVLLSLALPLSGPLAGQGLMVRWFTRQRGLALGLVSVGSSIGGFLMPPLVTYMVATLGWRGSHLVIAGVVLVVFVPLVLLFVRSPPMVNAAAGQPAGESNAPSDDGYPVWTTASVLRSRTFLPLVISLLPLAISVLIFTANFGPYTLDLGIASQQAGFLLSFFAITMIVGKLLVSSLCDLVDFRLVYAGVIILLATGMAVLTTSPGYLTLMAASTMIGVSAGSFVALMGAIVGRQFGPRGFGRAAGMLFFAYCWTTTTIPLSAWVRDTTGSYNGVWWTLVGVALCCSLFMLLVRPVPMSKAQKAPDA